MNRKVIAEVLGNGSYTSRDEGISALYSAPLSGGKFYRENKLSDAEEHIRRISFGTTSSPPMHLKLPSSLPNLAKGGTTAFSRK
jgi:hypothetical protein